MRTNSIEHDHLIVTVHGIRTFGLWTRRLEHLVRSEDDDVEFLHYNFGYFSFIAFLIPPLRWIATRRFRLSLLSMIAQRPRRRVDIVAHSFGTHLSAWALQQLSRSHDFRIHTFILSGSVLRTQFRWDRLVPLKIGRVINDCGIQDRALIASQIFVLFTGMAGRVGFTGALGRTFRNRYFDFGHSGFFDGDEFMQAYWVPLLTGESDIPHVDQRRPLTIYGGIVNTLLNNMEPMKLSTYFGGVSLAFFWVFGLLLESEAARTSLESQIIRANTLLNIAREQLSAALIGVGRSHLDDKPHESVRYAEAAARFTSSLGPAFLLRDAALRYPKYAQIVPENARLDDLPFLPRGATPHDIFAVDPSAKMVVSVKSLRVGSDEASTEIVIRDIETTAELSSRRLNNNESFVTQGEETSRLFMVKRTNETTIDYDIFDFSTGTLKTPALTIQNAKVVKTSSGEWPIYALLNDGHLMKYLEPITNNQTPVTVGRYEKVIDIDVHPNVPAVALIEEEKIVLFDTEQKYELSIDIISKFGKWNPRQDLFLWGSENNTALFYKGGSNPILYAYSLNGDIQEVWRRTGQFIVGAAPARSSKGDRFIFADRESNGGRTILAVLDMDWKNGWSKISTSHLIGNTPGTSIIDPRDISINPDGTVVVASYAVTGISGTQLSTNRTDLWDLTTLRDGSSLQPTSIELHPGRTPVIRSTFGAEGGRIVLFDLNNNIHVFNVDGGAQRRLTRPKLTFLDQGRVVDARYGNLLESYDLETGVATTFKFPGGVPKAIQIDADGPFAEVAGGRTFMRIGPDGLATTLDFDSEIRHVIAKGQLWLIQLATKVIVVDPIGVRNLGPLRESPETERLLRMTGGGAFSGYYLQKMDDGRYSFCIHTRDGVIGCWFIEKNQNKDFVLQAGLSFQPNVPAGGELLFTVLNRPVTLDTAFIVNRSKDNNHKWGRHQFFQYTISTANESHKYAFPDLPTDDFRGISWSRVTSNLLVVIGFFAGQDANFFYATCTFPVQGGDCPNWVLLPTEADEVLFTTEDNQGEVQIALLEYGYRGPNRGMLVRASDGKVLWSGDLLADELFPFLKPSGSEEWKIANYDIWQEVSRRVALGGDINMYQAVSKVPSAEIDENSIREIESQTPSPIPRLNGWSLLLSFLGKKAGY